MELRELRLIKTREQLLELVPSAMKGLNGIELLQALSTARREQHAFRNSIMVKGAYYRKNTTLEQIQELELINYLREKLEEEMYLKQGYVPNQITQNLLLDSLKKYRAYHKKMGFSVSV